METNIQMTIIITDNFTKPLMRLFIKLNIHKFFNGNVKVLFKNNENELKLK